MKKISIEKVTNKKILNKFDILLEKIKKVKKKKKSYNQELYLSEMKNIDKHIDYYKKEILIEKKIKEKKVLENLKNNEDEKTQLELEDENLKKEIQKYILKKNLFEQRIKQLEKKNSYDFNEITYKNINYLTKKSIYLTEKNLEIDEKIKKTIPEILKLNHNYEELCENFNLTKKKFFYIDEKNRISLFRKKNLSLPTINSNRNRNYTRRKNQFFKLNSFKNIKKKREGVLLKNNNSFLVPKKLKIDNFNKLKKKYVMMLKEKLINKIRYNTEEKIIKKNIENLSINNEELKKKIYNKKIKQTNLFEKFKKISKYFLNSEDKENKNKEKKYEGIKNRNGFLKRILFL